MIFAIGPMYGTAETKALALMIRERDASTVLIAMSLFPPIGSDGAESLTSSQAREQKLRDCE